RATVLHIASLGQWFVVAALVVALLGVGASAGAVIRGSARWARWTRGLALAAFGLVTAGAGVLLYALLTDDFSFRYVFSHSYRLQPTAYKIAALWSGQEGSLLFWTWLQAGYAALLARQKPERLGSTQAPALGIMLASVVFFGGVTAFVGSPFATEALAPPAGGALTPLLQSVWVVSPLVRLYMGCVGFSVRFAVASASLTVSRKGNDWIGLTRGWTMPAWLALSLGMVL